VDDSEGVLVEPEVSGVRVLPARIRPPIAVLSVLSAITLVVLAFVFAGTSTAGEFGIPAEHRPLATPWAQLALIIDWTSEPVGAVVIVTTLVIVFLRKGNRRAVLLAVGGTVATVALTTGMKPLVDRTINNGFLSFPSGHTATAATFALIATLWAGRLWLTALVTVSAAGAMAWSQVALNAHYPTDTVGGLCAALAVVPTAAWLIDWLAGAGRRPEGHSEPDPPMIFLGGSWCPRSAAWSGPLLLTRPAPAPSAARAKSGFKAG
jgi:membrane-associated phospholipid phosphatase